MTRLIAVTLVLVGAFLVYADDILAALHWLRQCNPVHHLQAMLKRAKKLRKLSLKQKLAQLSSHGKQNFFQQAYSNMAAILSATGSADMIKVMRLISVLCGATGVVVSIYLGSYMLVPILGVGFALLPMWLTKFRHYRYQIMVMNELSVVLSMITNSYVRCENIVKAVQENLEYMNEPVKGHFKWFCTMCTSVSSNISGNLEAFKRKIDNPIFKLWCDCLIVCQKDIHQKHSLNAVVGQFATDRELINLLRSEIAKPVKIFVLLAAVTMSAFPLSEMMSSQLSTGTTVSNMLFTSLGGQFLVVGYAITLLFGVNKAIDLSTQL